MSGNVVSQMLGLVASVAVGTSITAAVVSECLYDVDGGQRVVMFDRFGGVRPEAIGEGSHFMIPFLQTPHFFDVRSRPKVISSVTGTKDMQQVNISLRVLSRPKEDELATIFQALGTEYDERIMPSIGNEVLKSVVAQFNADQLLTQREKISREIRSLMNERSGKFNIILDDVSITHLSFGKEFTRAIEAKQVAQQDAERSKFVVMKTEQEKKAAVIHANGESEAAKLLSDSFLESGEGLIDMRRIEASVKIAENLSRSRNVVYLPSGNNGGANGGSGILLNVDGK